MPQEGFKSVTISEEIYNLAKQVYLKYKSNLRKRRIRSVAHLVEEAILDYIEKLEREEGKLATASRASE